MKRRVLLSFSMLIIAALPLRSQNIADTFSTDFVNWIKVIGSDEFGGRAPMTPYETKTIEYLAGEFRSLGLVPAVVVRVGEEPANPDKYPRASWRE